MAAQSLEQLEALLASLGIETPIPVFPRSDVLHRPVDIHRAYLADSASKALSCAPELAWEAVQVVSAAIPRDNADLDLVLPKLKLRSSESKNLGAEAAPKFNSTPLFQLPVVDKVHLRFFFSHKTLPQILLPYIDSQLANYGCNSELNKREVVPDSLAVSKKVLVDFSRPKLASEFNAAQLRSTIVGSQVANLYEAMGWDVVRLNFLGDWGKDLGLLAVGWGRFGSEEAFQRDPIIHVLEVYEKISELFQPEKEAWKAAHDDKSKDETEIEQTGLFAERDAFFKRMEDGDPEAVALWKRIRDVSIKSYEEAYARLNVRFDWYSGESQVSPESMAEVETMLKDKGFCEKVDGAWIVDFTKHGPKKLGTATLRTRMGSTSYILRDIAAVLDREKQHSFDKMVYVIDGSQDTHFAKVFQALRYMGHDGLADKLEHVSLGKVSGMSHQLGRVQLLGDIIDQSVSAVQDALGTEQDHPTAIENTDAAAAVLGATSLIAQDAFHKTSSAYTFSSDKLVSFESRGCLSLQASLAQYQAKVLEWCPDGATLAELDYTFLQEESSMDVLRLMAQYPDVTMAAYKVHEPSLVMNYMLRLVDEVECAFGDADDDDDEQEEQEGGQQAGSRDDTEAANEPNEPDSAEKTLAKAILLKQVNQILTNGMRLLGVTPIVN